MVKLKLYIVYVYVWMKDRNNYKKSSKDNFELNSKVEYLVYVERRCLNHQNKQTNKLTTTKCLSQYQKHKLS